MGLPMRSGSAPFLLLGPSAKDPTFDVLVDRLADYGCRVKTFTSLPVEGRVPRRAKALVIVTQSDTMDSPQGQQVQGLIREAGFLEAQIGRGNVLLLVDESAPRLSDTGLAQIRYPAGNLVGVLPEIAARFELDRTHLPVSASDDLPERDLHRQVPISEQIRAADLRVPWILVLILLLVAGLAGLLAYGILAGDSDRTTDADQGPDNGSSTGSDGGDGADDGGDSDATVTITSLTAALNNDPAGPSAVDRSSGQLGGASAAASGSSRTTIGNPATTYVTIPTVAPPDNAADGTSNLAGATSDGSGGSPTGTAASATTTTTQKESSTAKSSSTTKATEPKGSTTVTQAMPPTIDESITGLPATCYIDLRKNELIGSEILCEGSGKVLVTGWTGEWHNEVWALAIGNGVTGTLFHEIRPDGSTNGPAQRDLNPGIIYLDEKDSLYGVYYIKLQFGADEQHIHLYQHPDRGGEEAILIFRVA